MSIGLTQSAGTDWKVDPSHEANGAPARVGADRSATRRAVAIVVPCFNEREALPQLFERLDRVESAFAGSADIQWCFVDDGSDDGTWSALRERANGLPNYSLVRHESNQGISAAILTGFGHTDAPIVCSIDADCTYDPVQLPALVARLDEDVALVTASPYHPDGSVSGVAAWRLWLSKLASACYRRLSQNKLHTYTSCFRAYRREAVGGIDLKHRRYAGMVEILWQIDRKGGRVVEHPIVLHCRMVGRSKLRVAPVMLEHARLLTRCAWERLFRSRHPLRKRYTCPASKLNPAQTSSSRNTSSEPRDAS